MHVKVRSQAVLALLAFFVVSSVAGCGGSPACTGCTYGKAKASVKAPDLEGGRLTQATLRTSVKHDVCPYQNKPSPCTASLTIDVTCAIKGADTYEFKQRPNGYSDRSSGNAELDLVLTTPTGSTLTKTVDVEMTASDETEAVWPCNAEHDPTVQ